MPGSCPCGHGTWAAPANRREALALARHHDEIAHLLTVVARDSGRRLGVLRCTRCRRLWAEDSMTSGHADMFFIYPIDATDPEDWPARARPLNPPPG
ncbi:hypothetical protein [Thermopolyspora flexuosa]|jgi:hypothetical protein|uniref:Uncharacterized protein n=1 Tax=Thermopolyspora flexuosa TaxID=103836 RepID=A0A543IPJ9_9ACTN|nr:hypothetical protein [Thermopolyspora flexuosa]TQM72506.1 hypothetical protein FHX40_4651 [Thermopolyspora flexuosa]